MFLSHLFALSFFVFPSFIQAFQNASPRVKESINPPRNWVKRSPAHPDHIIRLRIGLPQPNFDTLERHLFEVSDPYHERYGNHMSKEDVEALVAPHPDSLRLVDNWLVRHGIAEDALERSPAKDWVTIKVPVSVAEKMLDTVCRLLPGFSSYSSIIDLPHLESYRQRRHRHSHN